MLSPLKVLPPGHFGKPTKWNAGHPKNFKYKVSFAVPHFISNKKAEIVSQYISGFDYWAELLTLSIAEDTELTLVVDYPLICVALLLKGDMNEQKLGNQKLSFTAGTEKIFYLPKGDHKISLLKDDYIVLYFVPPRVYLEEMAVENPKLLQLLKKVEKSSDDGDMMDSFHFGGDVFKTIMQIEERHYSQAAITMVIRQHLLKLLTNYHEHLTGTKKLSVPATTQQKAYLVRDYILNNLGNPELGGLNEFSQVFYISRKSLSAEFRSLTGQSIPDFIASRRMQWAIELLSSTNMRVFEIARIVGYSDTANFIRRFKKQYGYSPGRSKRK
ncbi:MAG TPA: AraC family transcriptional regulator [Chitinophagaceae bacterium]